MWEGEASLKYTLYHLKLECVTRESAFSPCLTLPDGCFVYDANKIFVKAYLGVHIDTFWSFDLISFKEMEFCLALNLRLLAGVSRY
jgi:hypothetical protein